jgi:hypothetical protein
VVSCFSSSATVTKSKKKSIPQNIASSASEEHHQQNGYNQVSPQEGARETESNAILKLHKA